MSSENLAGYAVYRAVGDGPPGRVTTTPVAGTAFLDDPGEVPPGTVLRWTVTAVERSEPGGESAMSEGAAAVAGAP